MARQSSVGWACGRLVSAVSWLWIEKGSDFPDRFQNEKWNARAHSIGEHLQRFQSPRSYRAHALSSVAKSSLSQLDMFQYQKDRPFPIAIDIAPTLGSFLILCYQVFNIDWHQLTITTLNKNYVFSKVHKICILWYQRIQAGHKFLCSACHRSSTALMRPYRPKQSATVCSYQRIKLLSFTVILGLGKPRAPHGCHEFSASRVITTKSSLIFRYCMIQLLQTKYY